MWRERGDTLPGLPDGKCVRGKSKRKGQFPEDVRDCIEVSRGSEGCVRFGHREFLPDFSGRHAITGAAEFAFRVESGIDPELHDEDDRADPAGRRVPRRREPN